MHRDKCQSETYCKSKIGLVLLCSRNKKGNYQYYLVLNSKSPKMFVMRIKQKAYSKPISFLSQLGWVPMTKVMLLRSIRKEKICPVIFARMTVEELALDGIISSLYQGLEGTRCHYPIFEESDCNQVLVYPILLFLSFQMFNRLSHSNQSFRSKEGIACRLP